MNNAHTCHAIDCDMLVPPKMLMCRDHWKLVPQTLQDAVWLHYRTGQEIDKETSEEWQRAADAAIIYVARREGKRK